MDPGYPLICFLLVVLVERVDGRQVREIAAGQFIAYSFARGRVAQQDQLLVLDIPAFLRPESAHRSMVRLAPPLDERCEVSTVRWHAPGSCRLREAVDLLTLVGKLEIVW
eukprot:scaffold1542_cov402-Prasinococcus_capsulatus_cf.AAC.6